MKRLLHNIKRLWTVYIISVVYLILVIVFVVIVFFLKADPNLSNAIVAFGTLTLAYATVMSIINSNMQEKRRIDREHKRQTLNDIREWTKSAINLFSNYQRQQRYKGSFDVFAEEGLLTRLQSLWAEKDAIVIAAGELDSKIAEDVEQASNKLEDYFINITGGTAPTKPTAEECEKTFVLLLGIVSDLKVGLKL